MFDSWLTGTLALQLNCLSEVLFEPALRRASQLDSYITTHGKPIGPLHGLPISLKDQFRVEGAETSVGFVGWLGNRETGETESEMVKMLMEMGAIIHVKSNVPPGLMVWRSAALVHYRFDFNFLFFIVLSRHSYNDLLTNRRRLGNRDEQQYCWLYFERIQPPSFVWGLFWRYVCLRPPLSHWSLSAISASVDATSADKENVDRRGIIDCYERESARIWH